MLTGIATLIAELDAAETDFEQTSITYDEEKAKEGAMENATTLKKEVATIINEKLLVYLDAMVFVNPTMYNEFALTVAQIIEDNILGFEVHQQKSHYQNR